MKWLILLAALFVGGCSHDIEPTQEDLNTMWEQQNVFPAHYKDDLLAFLRTYLNDPTHIKEAQVSQPVRKKMGRGERYVVCTRFNARNSDGKYIGNKESAAVYVDGKLNRYIDAGREADAAREVKDLCKDVPLAPFPALEKLSR